MNDIQEWLYSLINYVLYIGEYDEIYLREYLKENVQKIKIDSISLPHYIGYEKTLVLNRKPNMDYINDEIITIVNEILDEKNLTYLNPEEKKNLIEEFIEAFTQTFPNIEKKKTIETILNNNLKAIELNPIYDNRYFRLQKKIRISNPKFNKTTFHEMIHAYHVGNDVYQNKYYYGIDEGFTELSSQIYLNGTFHSDYINNSVINNGYKDIVLLTQQICKLYDTSEEYLIINYLKRKNIFKKLEIKFGVEKAQEIILFFEKIYNEGDIYSGNYVLFEDRLNEIEDYILKLSGKKFYISKEKRY